MTMEAVPLDRFVTATTAPGPMSGKAYVLVKVDEMPPGKLSNHVLVLGALRYPDEPADRPPSSI